MNNWHCAIDGVKYGPVSTEDMHRWLAQNRLKPTDYVWTEGMPDWAPCNTVEELHYGAAPQIHVPIAPQPVQQPTNGMAVAGMVLGIVSIVLVCVWFVSVPCAIVGLCLSVLGRNRAQEINSGEGMAGTGLGLSCVTLALLLRALLAGLAGLSMIGETFRRMPR